MKALVAAYLEQLSQQFAPTTLDCTRMWLARFLDFFAGPPKELTLEHIQAYRQQLLWQPGSSGRLYAPNTVYMAQRTVRSFLRWATQTGHIARDLTRGWVLPKPLSRSGALLSAEELLRVLSAPAADPVGWRDRAALELFAQTGLGPKRCSHLNLDHLLLPEGWLTAGRRPLRLSPRLLEHLNRYLTSARPHLATARETALFVSQHGTRWSAIGLHKISGNYAEQVGLARVAPRTLYRSQQAQLAQVTRRLPL